MAAVGALASLLALLAANTTSQLDCLCRHIDRGRQELTATLSDAEIRIWDHYCKFWRFHQLLEMCEALEPRFSTLETIARLLPYTWQNGREGECGAALAELNGITGQEAKDLPCHVADVLTEYCLAHGFNDTKWTAEMLAASHLWQPKLYQLMLSARCITKALDMMHKCRRLHYRIVGHSPEVLASFLNHYSNSWRRTAQLVPHIVTRLSQLFIPFAYQHRDIMINDQQLPGWIKNMERMRDMLNTKLSGLVYDAQLLSEQIAKYKIEEDKDTTGKYKIRRPLLSDGLLAYQEDFLPFRGDFRSLCEQHLTGAKGVFGLANGLYTFYRYSYYGYWIKMNKYGGITVDEEWQLEDQSNTMVWVDTGCLQVLVDTVDQPRCPLEELPPEASRQRKQCREQLWQDLVERPPRPPVTSYLAYTEKTTVSLCLLAWMAANSRSLCQDVPFSVLRSVHDAACYFDSPHNKTCLPSNAKDAICSVSRGIIMMKCRDFPSVNNPNPCSVEYDENGGYSERYNKSQRHEYYKVHRKATERTLSYRERLNRTTLKYKDFKLEILKPLEFSFISINIMFRLLTASVYMWLPHLHNLPGKILLSFQLTGLAQVLCSEVSYRMVGFPDLSTAVLVDSCLTLLGCLWLNIFSFQMYACVRDLRLPDHLTPAEASMVFRRQLRWALIPWAIVSTACAAMEKSSKDYLMHSRITSIVAISSSIALNLVLLGLVAFIYLRNKKSMRRLNIIGGDKGFSKKQLTFMSVNTIILSGICVIIRIGFHQATGIAQYVYYVHIATMLQGPVLFVFFICNGKTLPALKNRVLALCRPDVYRPQLELCSAAEKNLARRRGEPPLDAETAL